MENEYCEIKNTYIPLKWGQGGVLYEPVNPDERSRTGIMLMHSDGDYYGFVPAPELAKRGYTVLASNVVSSTPVGAIETMEDKLLDLKAAVEYLKNLPQVEKVVLLGHSGGATLNSAYQAVAENGVAYFQDDHKIVKLGDIGPLPKADAIMLLDSNWGNGVMTLLSLEPGITDNSSSRNLKPGYDLFDPANGYSPEGATYSPAFIRHYQDGQAARNDQLIDYALGRLKEIENGTGKFDDDEPFVVAGMSQLAPNNKMLNQDVHLLSHTMREWPIIHADGSITTEIIRSWRKPHFDHNFVTEDAMGTGFSTIKTYLSNSCVRTDGFYYDESHIYGIDWDSSFTCTPGNVKGVHVPALIMGMTGSYEFMAAEQIYDNIASTDKTMCFVEGASHNFTPQEDAEDYPGQFGDTVKNCFDYVAKWLEETDF